MRVIRRDSEIHDVSGGWFRARWHFSFDTYQDPENDSFGAMRVFNDDRLMPGAVWPLHPHRDVEGLTYVVEGLFGHEDNVGGRVRAAARGIGATDDPRRRRLALGAERLEDRAMRFIQIWILPDTAGLPPGVEQRVLHEGRPIEPTASRLRADGRGRRIRCAAVGIHQDASVYIASLDPGVEVRHAIGTGRGAYLYSSMGASRLGRRMGRGRHHGSRCARDR